MITNPGFIEDRGDSYLDEVDPRDVRDLYRSGSLRKAGVRLAGGTDAPFGPPDPWQAVRAAITRTTRSGKVVAVDERLNPRDALSLFQGSARFPEIPRTIRAGEPADLCVLDLPLPEALKAPSAESVVVCVVRGDVISDCR